jgi:hypothetical protein
VQRRDADESPADPFAKPALLLSSSVSVSGSRASALPLSTSRTRSRCRLLSPAKPPPAHPISEPYIYVGFRGTILTIVEAPRAHELK